MKNKFSLIGVPIDCIGIADKPGGTERSPAVLRECGLVKALRADDCGDLPVRIERGVRDPASGIVGFHSVCLTTATIRQAVREKLVAGKRPFLVGGCCTEVMGAVAGARDHFGRIGLAYLDGHLDLYTGITSPTGEAADMPIAALLGYGPEGLFGPRKIVLPEDLALLGYRDLEDARAHNSLLPDDIPGPTYYDAERIRRRKVADGLGRKLALDLEIGPMKRYWVHLDFDILDPRIFPATDYRMPGGLTWPELVKLARPICCSSAMVGMSIACYNPEKDPDRKCAQAIVAALTQIFAG